MNIFQHSDIPFAANEFLKSKDEFNRRLEAFMEGYLEEEYELCCDAEERLSAIRDRCRMLSEGREVETVVSKEHLLVFVTFSVPTIMLTEEKLAVMKELLSLSSGVEIYNRNGLIGFNVNVPYYLPGQKTPYLKAMERCSAEK